MGLFRSIQIMDSLGKASSLIEEYRTLTPGGTTKTFVAINTMQISERDLEISHYIPRKCITGCESEG